MTLRRRTPEPNAPTPELLPLADLLRPDAGAARRPRRSRCRSCRAGRRRCRCRATAALRALDPGSMLLVVLGQTFHGTTRRTTPTPDVPKHQPPYVRYDAAPGQRAARAARAARCQFQLMVPTVLERNSYPDTLPRRQAGAAATRSTQRPQGGAARLPHRRQRVLGHRRRPTGTTRPRSPTRASGTTSAGREFDLYYSGSHLHMVVLRAQRRDLLGREHAARLALERDDAGDRQGPQTANKRPK